MATARTKFIKVFTIPELRKKILFVLALLLIYRLAAAIPVPGIDVDRLQQFFNSNQLFGLLNLFSGGGLSNISIVMLGVGPYITSSIIMQLLTMIIPSLHTWYKEAGEAGRAKFNQITRVLTIPLAIVQAYGLISLFQNQGLIDRLSPFEFGTVITLTTAGTIFLMWIGELITEKGIGNGVSLLIFAGIIAGLPTLVQQQALTFDSSNIPLYIGFLAAVIVVIAGVVFVTEAQRNIPVSYARGGRAGKSTGGVSTHLPLRVNQAGVMPIIFAVSVVLLPGVVANFLAVTDIEWLKNGAQSVADLFENQTFYGIAYFLLTVLFTYFYTSVVFEPNQVAETLQKNGGFIPGVRPGASTESFLARVSSRITLVGALFLGLVAVLPVLVQIITGTQALVIGGTGLLIVVSVIIEVMKQVESQIVTREYDQLS